MTWLIIAVAVLVVAFLLYRGNQAREQRRLEKAREAEKLESQVQDHRAMSTDHQEKAGELKAEAQELEQKADRELDKAARHEVMADEISPDADTDTDAAGRDKR